MLEGFPFYPGTLAFILGVLSFGSEYGWGTLKTLLTQRPSRLRVFAAKLAALGMALTLLAGSVFLVAAAGSYIVAVRENAAVDWPGIFEVARGFGAGTLILALWGSFGVLLAVLGRGAALPIGVGILYGWFIEGPVTTFGAEIQVLQEVAYAFLRTNGYSLVAPLGVSVAAEGEPGAFSGPFVDSSQALLVLIVYLAVFGGTAALVLKGRDVT